MENLVELLKRTNSLGVAQAFFNPKISSTRNVRKRMDHITAIHSRGYSVIKMNSDFIKMAVFLVETDNSSRRIIRLLFYVSSINTGRTTKKSLKEESNTSSQTHNGDTSSERMICRRSRIYTSVDELSDALNELAQVRPDG